MPDIKSVRSTLEAHGQGHLLRYYDDLAPPQAAALLDQLAEKGRLVIPEGKFLQELVVYEKLKGEIKRREVISVRFVPMTGRAEKQ